MKSASLRILAVSALWQGANDYAFVRALRRAGHSVTVVPADSYVPRWERKSLRILRRLLMPVFVREYNKVLVSEAEHMRPDLFFVFKGQNIISQAMDAIKATGAIAINYYPDTGFADHGPYLPQTIRQYDWVFTTKPSGVADLQENYGVGNAGFLPHSFDPETHRPFMLSARDERKYQCDVSFIGNTSPKKQKVLKHVCNRLPDANLLIWGPPTWNAVKSEFGACYQGAPVYGAEYAKAIGASKINLGILYEGGASAPEGDVITSRTFHIPAVGGFMLHERSKEAMKYFEEDKECVFYSDPDDLVTKIRYYLEHPGERKAIAKAGQQRCLSSGYSSDDRVQTVLAKFKERHEARK